MLCAYRNVPNVAILQMNIQLKRDIVIFDEAHNIEDAAREAASIQITQKDLQDVERSFTGFETPLMMETLNKLKHYLAEEGDKIRGLYFPFKNVSYYKPWCPYH